MKKATITSVNLVNGTYIATYTSGTTRSYQPDKLPQTVRAWMDAQQAEPVAEVIPEDAPDVEPVAEPEADKRKPDAEPVAEVVAVTKAEPMAVSISQVVPAQVAEPVTLPTGLWPLAWLLWGVVNVLTDAYYWTTTYLPIWAGRIRFVLAWDVLPVLSSWMATGARMAARASVRGARLAVMASRTAVRAALAIGTGIAAGWEFRAELIREAA